MPWTLEQVKPSNYYLVRPVRIKTLGSGRSYFPVIAADPFYFLIRFYWSCYYSCPSFSPFALLHPAPAHSLGQSPPPLSMGQTYVFFGYSISYTVLYIPVAILGLGLGLCYIRLISDYSVTTNNAATFLPISLTPPPIQNALSISFR